MFSLIHLVTNEWVKITKKKGFYVGLALVAFVCFVAAFFIRQVIGLDFMDQAGFVNTMIAFNGGGALYLILSALVAAGIVSSEHQLGTVKLLLIRSHPRTKILLSKLLAVLLYMVVLLLFYIVIAYVAAIIFLTSGESLGLSEILQTAGFTALYALAYVVIAFMLSTILKNTGATIGITFSFMFIEGLIVMLINRYEAAKFYLFNHVDFSVFANGGQHAIEGVTLPFSILIYSIYLLIFLAATFIVFKKRDVA